MMLYKLLTWLLYWASTSIFCQTPNDVLSKDFDLKQASAFVVTAAQEQPFAPLYPLLPDSAPEDEKEDKHHFKSPKSQSSGSYNTTNYRCRSPKRLYLSAGAIADVPLPNAEAVRQHYTFLHLCKLQISFYTSQRQVL